MSVSEAAYAAEKAIGHDDNAVTQQDVSEFSKINPSGETMKALAWMGKHKVEIGEFFFFFRFSSFFVLPPAVQLLLLSFFRLADNLCLSLPFSISQSTPPDLKSSSPAMSSSRSPAQPCVAATCTCCTVSSFR